MRLGLAGAGRIGAFHATTLVDVPAVSSLVVADADPSRAAAVADKLGVEYVERPEDLLRQGLDGFVIAAATDAHADLIVAAVDAGVTTFCEKPVAPDTTGTQTVLDKVAAAAVPVQIGFQRRFDAGYVAARAAVQSGELGWIHSMRASTTDQSPPPAEYIPHSGGFFRDCNVHDFDIVRWVSGQEVVEVYALGGNKAGDYIEAAGDIDTASALLTMADGTLVQVMGTRYNGRGHDVRLEVLGSRDSISVGLDDRLPLRSAEPGVTFPGGTPYVNFMDRFHRAYVAELTAFTEVVAGTASATCTVADALEAFLIAEACERSRHEHRPVTIAEVRPA